MSYHEVPKGNADRELGRKIYMRALEDRRGFRYDQLGIDDADIWAEIFESIGEVARKAITARARKRKRPPRGGKARAGD